MRRSTRSRWRCESGKPSREILGDDLWAAVSRPDVHLTLRDTEVNMLEDDTMSPADRSVITQMIESDREKAMVAQAKLEAIDEKKL